MVLKKFIQNRKGISHIEVILSFVIFIGFSIFLFAILNPFSVSGEEVYLDVLNREIADNASLEVRFQTLRIDKDLNRNCFYFTYSFENIIVKNQNYNAVRAFSENGKVYVNSDERFFYISSSDEFVENSFNIRDVEEVEGEGCDNLQISNNYYVLGLFRNYNFISLNKLTGLHNNIMKEDEYVKIKQDFGIGGDFSFGAKIDGEIILDITRNPPKTKVSARSFPIQLVYSNGEIKYAKLNILVW